METFLIVCLSVLTVGCCVMFWWCVLRPVRKHFEHEHVIAAFRREISEWEHDQQCR